MSDCKSQTCKIADFLEIPDKKRLDLELTCFKNRRGFGCPRSLYLVWELDLNKERSGREYFEVYFCSTLTLAVTSAHVDDVDSKFQWSRSQGTEKLAKNKDLNLEKDRG